MAYLMIDGGVIKTTDGTVIEGVQSYTVNRSMYSLAEEIEIKVITSQVVHLRNSRLEAIKEAIKEDINFDEAINKACEEYAFIFGPNPSELVDNILHTIIGIARKKLYDKYKNKPDTRSSSKWDILGDIATTGDFKSEYGNSWLNTIYGNYLKLMPPCNPYVE